MFNFFLNLYYAVVQGNWIGVQTSNVFLNAKLFFDSLPIWNMFNQCDDNVCNIDIAHINDFLSVIFACVCCGFVFFMIVKLFTWVLDAFITPIKGMRL